MREMTTKTNGSSVVNGMWTTTQQTLGMWRSSHSNSNAGEFRKIWQHSTFDECWNCIVDECEFEKQRN